MTGCTALRHADWAWLILAGVVVGYEVVAATRRDWELLSEAADRYRAGHPLATHVTVLYLAGHLLRRWPAKLDPLHMIAANLK